MNHERHIKALLAHAQGDIAKHKANVEVYLNLFGVGEHSNVLEAIEEEINMIAKYQDQRCYKQIFQTETFYPSTRLFSI